MAADTSPAYAMFGADAANTTISKVKAATAAATIPAKLRKRTGSHPTMPFPLPYLGPPATHGVRRQRVHDERPIRMQSVGLVVCAFNFF